MATKQQAPKPVMNKDMEKRTISTNNYIALMAVLCVLMVLIAGFVGYKLGIQAYTKARVIAKKIDVSNKYKTKLENAKSLADDYQDLGSTRILIEHSLPNTPDFPETVSLLESAGNAATIKVKQIQPQKNAQGVSDVTKASTDPKPETASFTVDLEGNYAKLVDFLKNLELSSRQMRVKSGTFNGTDNALVVSLEVETYYQVKTDLNDKTEALK